ncbi:MAG: hypothetical protein IT507_18755 [Burkholderiaceae bacterium]|nr:hypothetical protein [Burkholderiaceae bacterium]
MLKKIAAVSIAAVFGLGSIAPVMAQAAQTTKSQSASSAKKSNSTKKKSTSSKKKSTTASTKKTTASK